LDFPLPIHLSTQSITPLLTRTATGQKCSVYILFICALHLQDKSPFHNASCRECLVETRLNHGPEHIELLRLIGTLVG
jgi:hypothetical protein